VDSAGPVGVAGLIMHLADHLGHHGVTDRADRGLAVPLHVETRHRHANHVAGHLGGEALADYLSGDLPPPFGSDRVFNSSFARFVTASSGLQLPDALPGGCKLC
jgi:hypothetical protein